MLLSTVGPVSAPVLIVNWLRAGFVEGASRVRVIVVVFTVVPFSATTRIWMVLLPTFKATGALTPELEVARPLTVTVAFSSAV